MSYFSVIIICLIIEIENQKLEAIIEKYFFFVRVSCVVLGHLKIVSLMGILHVNFKYYRFLSILFLGKV